MEPNGYRREFETNFCCFSSASSPVTSQFSAPPFPVVIFIDGQENSSHTILRPFLPALVTGPRCAMVWKFGYKWLYLNLVGCKLIKMHSWPTFRICGCFLIYPYLALGSGWEASIFRVGFLRAGNREEPFWLFPFRSPSTLLLCWCPSSLSPSPPPLPTNQTNRTDRSGCYLGTS